MTATNETAAKLSSEVMPADFKLPEIYGNNADKCHEMVVDAYKLLYLKDRANYDWAMKLTWRISCNSWDTKIFMSPLFAWYRVVVLPTYIYAPGSSVTWLAAAIVHEDCHANQIWHLRIAHGWTAETECALKQIDVMKKIEAPQGEIDWAQHFLDEHIQWW